MPYLQEGVFDISKHVCSNKNGCILISTSDSSENFDDNIIEATFPLFELCTSCNVLRISLLI